MNVANAKIVANAISDELEARGLPQSKLSMIMHQLAVETAGFTSKVSATDNNMSGVKFFGQNGATQGSPVPKSEYVSGAKYGNYYAHYSDLSKWAHDYLNILTKGSNPLSADNLTEFATKLKANGYFQAPLETYITALHSWESTFKKHFPFITKKGVEISLISFLAISIIIIVILKNL